jgi:DNA-directed RNA polymerase specialized sigma24 family protein
MHMLHRDAIFSFAAGCKRLCFQLSILAVRVQSSRRQTRQTMTQETYGQFYQDGRARTIRWLRSRGVARDLAPDIAQSAWLLGWQKISQLRDERTTVTWVNTIALNIFRRAMQRERRQQMLPGTVPGKTTLNLAAIDVARILVSCRASDRALLEAQMVGVTPREMAQEEGVSETAIRIRFLRARRSARTALQKPGPGTGAAGDAAPRTHPATLSAFPFQPDMAL